MERKIIVHLEGKAVYHKLFRQELKDRFGEGILYEGFLDPLAALDFIRRNKVSLIISCLTMQEGQMGGFDFLRECKRICPETPCIVHSALGYRDDFSLSGAAADVFVRKSTDPSELIAAIGERLQGQYDHGTVRV